ncbi:putative glycoside hydrolase [Paenibacillus whitsoniae]|uniref:GTP-binding protein n=1 Tax=Paenibacillus whitsoniae TaxID=2496558 RepID=A0A430JDD1_9BACL|nr:putative glycoside hydrolase [Paenibacillus whitsoniae]RTE09014.1 GTP-binding protein [Paenibacillus whitsoniae]
MVKSSSYIRNGKWICLLSALLAGGCATRTDTMKDDLNPRLAMPPTEHMETKPGTHTQAITPSSKAAPNDVKLSAQQTIHEPVKGIYVSAWSAVGSKFEQLIDLVDRTDLNAMVIDVKNDSGQITYPSKVAMVNEIGANSHVIIHDLQAKLQRLKQKQIYAIARLVVFKDPYLSKKKSQYAMKTHAGAVWKDRKGVAWVDPFQKEVWEYNLQIANEVAQMGFDEIQFDYVRFPENVKSVDSEVKFSNPAGLSKAQNIEAFLQQARAELGSKAKLSADVFGLTTSSERDVGIGQDWNLIAKQVHVISPMLYPSHYSSGMYGVKYPDLQPYAIVHQAIHDANGKNQLLKQANVPVAEIRPWYQDFTATWVKPHKTYGVIDVKEQIKAAREQGVEQFLLWNPSSNYSYR